MAIREAAMTDTHSCCKKLQQEKTLRSYVAAFVAAFLACLCCSLPLIPLMLGLSAGSSFLSLTKYHLLFDITGGLILLASLIYIWREHQSSEKPAWKSVQFWTCLLVTFIMYGAMTLVVKYVIAPRIPASAHVTFHDHH
jgi:hypothetical protein